MGGLDFLGDLLDTGPSNFVESASGFGGGGVPNISLAGSVFDPSNLTSMVPSMGGDLSGGGGGGFAGWLDKLGTGTQDILGKIGKSFTDDPFGSLLKTAQIGVAGAGVAAGIKGAQAGAQQAQIARQVENRAERMGEIQEKATARREEVAAVAEKRQEEITQPAADFAKTVTEAGKTGLLTGQLPPGLEAVVQDKMQRLRTDITSYLAKTGNADSTMARQWDTWLQQQELVMRAQLSQSLAQEGLDATGVAANANAALLRGGGATAGGAGAAAAASANNIANLIGQANNALGVLTGVSGTSEEERRRRAAAGAAA